MEARTKPTSNPRYIKVYNQEKVIEVALSKFNSYEELTTHIDQMFEFNGELIAPTNNWLIIYKDNEGKMLRVGEDFWMEFCWLACAIYICTTEEMLKMTKGRPLHCRNKDETVAEEGSSAMHFRYPSDFNFKLISAEELKLRFLEKRRMRSMSF